MSGARINALPGDMFANSKPLRRITLTSSNGEGKQIDVHNARMPRLTASGPEVETTNALAIKGPPSVSVGDRSNCRMNR